jgi:hypothetical protein
MLQSVMKLFGYVPINRARPTSVKKSAKRGAKSKKRSTKAAGYEAPKYIDKAKALDVRQSFTIESPKLHRHPANGKYYSYPYVSYFNVIMPTKRFSQITVEGKAIITRTK